MISTEEPKTTSLQFDRSGFHGRLWHVFHRSKFEDWLELTVVQQVCKYLTQFEADGYIVMINHTKKSIDLPYQKIVRSKASGYVSRSMKKNGVGKGIRYYSSRHRSASGEKEVYHFIINIV